MHNHKTAPEFESAIDAHRLSLCDHRLYDQLDSLPALRCFMEHHVFAVWDFMSLIKKIQSSIAPTAVPWCPSGNTGTRRFINELVLEEESDRLDDGRFLSHFELYLEAMTEVGADTTIVLQFCDRLRTVGVSRALDETPIPPGAKRFVERTFRFVEAPPHVPAAALAVGRELLIPVMFRRFLTEMRIGEDRAPMFHFYLRRHIELDQDFHAPMALELLTMLCGGDPQKTKEAIDAAVQAGTQRIEFWNAISSMIGRRQRYAT